MSQISRTVRVTKSKAAISRNSVRWGYADDAIIVALVLRNVVRRADLDAVRDHWPGTDDGFEPPSDSPGWIDHGQSLAFLVNGQHCYGCNVEIVSAGDDVEGRGWLVLLTRMPTEPARFRMALWRDLRRSGALLLGQGVWAVPDLPLATELIGRVTQLVETAGGTLLALSATGYGPGDSERLERLYVEAREEEWTEFRADCGKYLAELDKEEAIGKYTLAELEEEEQSLDRLRRWYRELRSRDLLGVTATTTATTELKICQDRFEQYAEHIYAALNSPHR